MKAVWLESPAKPFFCVDGESPVGDLWTMPVAESMRRPDASPNDGGRIRAGTVPPNVRAPS